MLLSPVFFFKFCSGSRKVRGNQKGLELNGLHQILAYADHVSLLGDGAGVIAKNAETLLHGSKERNLEVYIDETKNMSVIRDKHQHKRRNIIKGKTSFENASMFKYQGTITNIEMKSFIKLRVE